MRCTAPGAAPSAMRIPNSAVRPDTAYAMTPKRPTHARPSARIPKTDVTPATNRSCLKPFATWSARIVTRSIGRLASTSFTARRTSAVIDTRIANRAHVQRSRFDGHLRQRIEGHRPRGVLNAVDTRVFHDADDLGVDCAVADAPADSAPIGEKAPGHRTIDDGDLRRVLPVAVVETPALQETHARGRKIVRRDAILLQPKVFAGGGLIAVYGDAADVLAARCQAAHSDAGRADPWYGFHASDEVAVQLLQTLGRISNREWIDPYAQDLFL